LQNSSKSRLKNIYKIFIFISLLSVTSTTLNASGYDEKKPGDDKKAKTKAKDDTSSVSSNIAKLEDCNEEQEEPDTALFLFPSNDLYASWDTTMAHPYNFQEAFKVDSVEIDLVAPGDGAFTIPFKGNVTSEYGWRRRRPHYGTDIDLVTGDTVVAAFDGMVRIAKVCSGYGNCIIVRHTNGLETVYGHLSQMNVQVGQVVKAGEIIGLGGNTGRSTGDHLHWELRYLGQAIDAQDVVDFGKGQLKENCFVLRKTDVVAKYDLRALKGRHRRDVGLTKAELAYAKKTGSKLHKIKQGDTLGYIAKRYHTTVSALCKKNKLKPNSTLRLGQLIKI
jgi:murein DD-endopeptidase MepM/ murein hydrolase activator NlpD